MIIDYELLHFYVINNFMTPLLFFPKFYEPQYICPLPLSKKLPAPLLKSMEWQRQIPFLPSNIFCPVDGRNFILQYLA